MANNPHEHHPFMPWSPWAPADMGVPPYGVPMFVPPIPIWEQPPPPMNMWYSQYFANSPVFRDREVSLIFKTHTLMHVPLRTHVTHPPKRHAVRKNTIIVLRSTEIQYPLLWHSFTFNSIKFNDVMKYHWKFFNK